MARVLLKPYLLGFFAFLLLLLLIYTFSVQSSLCICRKKWLEKKHDEKILNLNFYYKILNLVCEAKTPDFIVIIASSAVNFDNRRVIRNTWARNQSIPIIFALASVIDENIQRKIEAENRKYSDIIQGNFIDKYRNLTYKHLMILKYVKDYCPKTKFLLKLDDDVFVNMPQMLNFIQNDLQPTFTHNVIICDPYVNSPVKRTNSKWSVTYQEFPSYQYPTFCPGWRIIYSMDMVEYLINQAKNKNVKFFWIDDVFVSGVLASHLKDVHKNITSLTMQHYVVDSVLENKTSYTPFLVASAFLNPKQYGPLLEVVLKNHPVQSFKYKLKWLN
ncbi:unnamed protein product [Brassicogethes aeneus]|uniref:Hexosyltransferase n=1 Tax=Brassicogethes aeneus TaxID=1431903 RepID=A0A9P0BID5_BRAAE|nr:unnamed protein product [Brassicogethes aeneus]